MEPQDIESDELAVADGLDEFGEFNELNELGDGPFAQGVDLEAFEAVTQAVEELGADTLPFDQQEVEAYNIDDDEFVKARRAARAAMALAQRASARGDDADDADEADSEGAPFDGLTEEILQAVPVWKGVFLTAENVSVRLPNGRIANRDILRHPGAVAIVALTDDGKIVLVHQYRTALEQVMLEIPAGKLELGEDPATAAARELLEETGYMADRIAYLGPMSPAPGYSDELLHLYMAMGLHFHGASPDEDEFLNVDLVDLGEMVDRVLDGKVVDAKTMVAVLLCDAISRRM